MGGFTLEALANFLGIFFGQILAKCAPVIVGILSEAIRNANSVETSNPPADLRDRLLRLLHKDDSNPKRDASADQRIGGSGSVGV